MINEPFIPFLSVRDIIKPYVQLLPDPCPMAALDSLVGLAAVKVKEFAMEKKKKKKNAAKARGKAMNYFSSADDLFEDDDEEEDDEEEEDRYGKKMKYNSGYYTDQSE